MSIVAAVKEAIETGCGDYWALNLPDDQKEAYYKNSSALRRENKDEYYDFLLMRSAEFVLARDGIRGLCYY